MTLFFNNGRNNGPFVRFFALLDSNYPNNDFPYLDYLDFSVNILEFSSGCECEWVHKFDHILNLLCDEFNKSKFALDERKLCVYNRIVRSNKTCLCSSTHAQKDKSCKIKQNRSRSLSPRKCSRKQNSRSIREVYKFI